MTNPHRGDTAIEVGGEKYTLCYDLNACAMVMERLGLKNFEELADRSAPQREGISMGLQDLLYILWAGLQRHHPELSELEVGALEWDMNEVGEMIGPAFQLGLMRKNPPPQIRSKKAGGRRRKTGTGRKHN